jgi:hypothetical protein
MATPSYRDTIRPSLIDTNIPSSGEAQAAEALARSLKDFERLGTDTIGTIREEQGRREGAEAGRTDDPGFRTGMRSLTAYGRAYNDAATRSYAIQSEAAADEAATRLELEAGNDPEVFKATFGARRDATLKAAPPEARVILSEVYDRRMAAGVQRLIGAQGIEMRNRARTDVAEGMKRSVDRIGQLLASNDPAQHAQADEELVKQSLMIDAAMADGTLSKVEGGALRVDAARAVTAQTVAYRFRAEMDNPYGDPVAFIERLKEMNKTSAALPPDEEEKLVTGLLNELQEKNALAAAGRNAQFAQQKVRWDAGEHTATQLLVDGRLTMNRISQMLEDDQIDPAIARTLRDDLKAGNDRPDDERERFYVETTLLEHTEEEIGQNSQLSWKTRRELIAKRRDLASGWRGTQQAREGAERIDRALGLPPGGALNQMLDLTVRKQRERALTAWYDKVDALPPAERQTKAIELAEEISDDVIRGNTARRLDTMRKRLEAVKTAAGPVEEMGEQQRKDFEADIAKREAAIRALEQQVK